MDHNDQSSSAILGDFGAKYLRAIGQELKCRICLQYLINPQFADCSHRFCASCISQGFASLPKIIRDKNSWPCPLCKTPVKRRSLKNDATTKELVEKFLELADAFENIHQREAILTQDAGACDFSHSYVLSSYCPAITEQETNSNILDDFDYSESHTALTQTNHAVDNFLSPGKALDNQIFPSSDSEDLGSELINASGLSIELARNQVFSDVSSVSLPSFRECIAEKLASESTCRPSLLEDSIGNHLFVKEESLSISNPEDNFRVDNSDIDISAGNQTTSSLNLQSPILIQKPLLDPQSPLVLNDQILESSPISSPGLSSNVKDPFKETVLCSAQVSSCGSQHNSISRFISKDKLPTPELLDKDEDYLIFQGESSKPTASRHLYPSKLPISPKAYSLTQDLQTSDLPFKDQHSFQLQINDKLLFQSQEVSASKWLLTQHLDLTQQGGAPTQILNSTTHPNALSNSLSDQRRVSLLSSDYRASLSSHSSSDFNLDCSLTQPSESVTDPRFYAPVSQIADNDIIDASNCSSLLLSQDQSVSEIVDTCVTQIVATDSTRTRFLPASPIDDDDLYDSSENSGKDLTTSLSEERCSGARFSLKAIPLERSNSLQALSISPTQTIHQSSADS